VRVLSLGKETELKLIVLVAKIILLTTRMMLERIKGKNCIAKDGIGESKLEVE